LIYGIAILGSVHFFIQSKLNIYEPALMAGFLLWLLAYRVLYRRNGGVAPAHLLVLTLVTALITALGEATIYMFTSGVDAWRVLLAHLDVDMEIRPAWWVLAAGLAVSAIGLWRWKPARQRASARKTSAPALSGATQVQSGS
jgi:methionine sulfoxide reductase heme-binding subunit